MWFLPLLLVGAIAMAVASRSSREPIPPSRQLSAPPPPNPSTPSGPSGLPGPISVLGEILRVGQTPPPMVILCAIAEAQSIGRNDLASDIAQVFVVPVVRHHQRERARAARSAYAYERGCYRVPGSCAPPDDCAPLEPPVVMPASPFGPRAEAAPVPPDVSPSTVSPSTVSPPMASPPMPSTDDDIAALLNADPKRFMELVSRSGTFPAAASLHAQAVSPPVATAPAAPLVAPLVGSVPVQPVEHIPSIKADPGSPIPGVSDSAWCDFAARLARESLDFSSSRHVGQYRQRKERLIELGIDPSSIAGSAAAQRTALDADLADAYRHATAGGSIFEHLGRAIALPGRDGTEMITLSGILGVIQCAGLEGAVGWLERSSDRKRYPHTTQAFLHTNGAF